MYLPVKQSLYSLFSYSNNYDRWWAVKMGNLKPGGVVATEFFETFKEFPPRQKPEKWNLSEIMDRIQSKGTNN